jgi:diguanylate cyclase (GGDEF)-like protein
VNPDKVRLSSQRERQEVTGLISNRFPNVHRSYVRQLRGLRHAWERYGVDAAAKEFFTQYDTKVRTGGSTTLLKKVVLGKIAFVGRVRGGDDPIYLKLLAAFAKLNPEFKIQIPEGADLGAGMQDDVLPLMRRRMFNRDLPAAFEQSSSAYPLSLLLIDVDHFKSVNDTYGHQTGDEVLIECSKMIARRCHGKGDAYRFGSNFTRQEAVALAELIRSDIEQARVASAKVSVTVSIGIATAPDHATTPDDLVKAADKAMYRAKDAGRNRTQVAGDAT